MRHFVVLSILILFILSCSENSNNQNSQQQLKTENIEHIEDEESKKKDLVITDNILYNVALRSINKEYKFGSFYDLIDELTKRVIQNNEQRAFTRLLSFSNKVDGSDAEYFSTSMGRIFKSDARYFLRNTYNHKNAEDIYLYVIYNNYMNEINEKKYPKNASEIKSYGEISKKFFKVYDIYLKKGF